MTDRTQIFSVPHRFTREVKIATIREEGSLLRLFMMVKKLTLVLDCPKARAALSTSSSVRKFLTVLRLLGQTSKTVFSTSVILGDEFTKLLRKKGEILLTSLFGPTPKIPLLPET
jgi:hypothetical protein